MVNSKISSHILTIGCDYQTTKGGISSVIDSYSKIFSPFNFIATTQTKSKLQNLLYLIYSLVKFTFKCFSKNIRIVHIHTASNTSFKRKAIYINIASFFQKKVVLHIHGGEFHLFYKKNTSLVAKTLKKVDTIIALSSKWKKFFEDSVGCKNVVIIPNIVSNPVIVDNKKSAVISGIFLGNMNKKKGIYDIIDMVNANKEYLRGKLTLHIGGNGETDKVQDLIKKNNLSDIIKYEGWVNKEKRAELLSSGDFFLLPSYNEGLPISILEAMSYRLPIISTPVGGIPEVIKHKENGYLHNPGDLEAMFECIKTIMENRENIKEMGEISFRKVEPHLPHNVSTALEYIYIKLLDKKNK